MIKHISIASRSVAALALGAIWATGALAADPVGSPAAAAPSSTSSPLTAKGIDAILGNSKAKTGGSDDFLQPDEAFRFDAIPDGPDHVKLIWQIADGYYLYRARIKVATTSDQAQLGALEMPQGETKTDEYFGKQEIYHHELVAGVPVARSSGAAFSLPVKVTYQGCATAGLCYPPITKELSVSLPAGNGAAPSALNTTMQAPTRAARAVRSSPSRIDSPLSSARATSSS